MMKRAHTTSKCLKIRHDTAFVFIVVFNSGSFILFWSNEKPRKITHEKFFFLVSVAVLALLPWQIVVCVLGTGTAATIITLWWVLIHWLFKGSLVSTYVVCERLCVMHEPAGVLKFWSKFYRIPLFWNTVSEYPPPPKMKIVWESKSESFRIPPPPKMKIVREPKSFRIPISEYQWETMCGKLPHVETLSNPDNYSFTLRRQQHIFHYFGVFVVAIMNGFNIHSWWQWQEKQL